LGQTVKRWLFLQFVGQPYTAVLNAENVGANGSGLIVRLNVAADFFSKAQDSFKLGSFDEAVRLAQFSIDSARDVVSDARKLFFS
jgi:hypothetical protein